MSDDVRDDAIRRALGQAVRGTPLSLFDQVSEDFGVCLRTKVMTIADQPIAQGSVIFDDTIVNERQFTAGIEVRVRVFVRDFSVRGPASVTDPERT